jgi:hypothetical protein
MKLGSEQRRALEFACRQPARLHTMVLAHGFKAELLAGLVGDGPASRCRNP